MLYAAYGSNLDTTRMEHCCPHSPAVSSGWLEGWRIAFGGESISWDGAVATLVEDVGSSVFVLLYDVTPLDREQLDEYEAVPFGLYRTIHVRAATLDGEELAWTYVLNDYEGGLPSLRYVSAMADAAAAAGAPQDYVAALRARPHG